MDKKWIRGVKTSFKSTASTSTTSESVNKIESISPDKFYGKTVGSIHLRTKEKEHVNKSPTNYYNKKKTYFEPGAQHQHPNGRPSKSPRTWLPRRANDDLPDKFIADFVSEICEKE